jgi:hypothetical protein
MDTNPTLRSLRPRPIQRSTTYRVLNAEDFPHLAKDLRFSAANNELRSDWSGSEYIPTTTEDINHSFTSQTTDSSTEQSRPGSSQTSDSIPSTPSSNDIWGLEVRSPDPSDTSPDTPTSTTIDHTQPRVNFLSETLRNAAIKPILKQHVRQGTLIERSQPECDPHTRIELWLETLGRPDTRVPQLCRHRQPPRQEGDTTD